MRPASQPETQEPAEPGIQPPPPIPAWQPVVFGASAGGLGWGIRGQYGHETGAMIAGVLVSLTLVLLLFRHAPVRTALRAVAWGTVAFGFGGAMTYGQTVGLTHDPALVGNAAALTWGLLGLAIKGGIWIGFGGLFLGMGLGGIRYRPLELVALFAAMLLLFFAGTALLNAPFDPEHRLLPAVYFSADWRWQPEAALKPRREIWGGLLLAWIGSVGYTTLRRRDAVASRLALWGALGGALGFPLGQSLQAFHAWNPDLFRSGLLATVDPKINWWNFMETTFGAVFGAVLGRGAWRSRHAFASPDIDPPLAGTPETPRIRSRAAWGIGLTLAHVVLLLLGEFGSVPILDQYTDLPLILGVLPILAPSLDRSAAWLVVLPVTALPIAIKTCQQLIQSKSPAVPAAAGWMVYVLLPVGLLLAVAWYSARQEGAERTAERRLRLALTSTVLLYFGLNFAFFRYPWPWVDWTMRTPNALVFTTCAAGLLYLAQRWRNPARG